MKEQSDQILQIENNYPVSQIQYHGIYLWGHIRIYLFDKLLSVNNGFVRRGKVGASSMKVILKGLFYYNPFRLFKKWDIWLFVAADRRKVVNEIAVHRVSGVIPEICKKTLLIEKPFPQFHFPNNQVIEKNIVSESILFIFTYIYEIALKIIKPKIENEEIIACIINDYNIKFEYKNVIYRFLSQYMMMKLLLKIIKKPKVVFIEVPYTSMGYILAFKRSGIKVIEMQHGVLNENHFAYNSILKNNQYLPDSILVYGNREYECFDKSIKCYVPKSHVEMVGSYILEKMHEQLSLGVFDSEHKIFQTIVVITAQELIETKLIAFVNEAAMLDKTVLYAYVPRIEKDYSDKLIGDNIKIVTGNVYNIIKECDIHSTVFSTTCIEAQYLKKINIFIDVDDLGSNYYGDILTAKDGAYYASSPIEFINLLQLHRNDVIKFETVFFANGHKSKMEKIINNYIK